MSGDRPMKHWPRRNWVAVGSINGEPYGSPEYCWSRRGAERYAALIQQRVRTNRGHNSRWAMTVLSRSEWDDTIATRID